MTVWRDDRTIATSATVTQGRGGRYRLAYEAPREAAGRVVYFDGKNHYQYEPRRNSLRRTPLTAESALSPPTRVDLIQRNYRVVLVSSAEKAAGRNCYLVRLSPLHQGKGREDLWIDRATYKVLRSETRYADASLARLVTYQQVTLPYSPRPDEFQPKTVARMHVTTGVSRSRPGTDEVRSHITRTGIHRQGPLGFALASASTYGPRTSRKWQFLYTDGLESISVFAEPGKTLPFRAGRGWRKSSIGALPSFERSGSHSQVLVVSRGRYRYTVMTHLTAVALRQFVAGLFS